MGSPDSLARPAAPAGFGSRNVVDDPPTNSDAFRRLLAFAAAAVAQKTTPARSRDRPCAEEATRTLTCRSRGVTQYR